jgi:hypothetical protein
MLLVCLHGQQLILVLQFDHAGIVRIQQIKEALNNLIDLAVL